jgi:hypothetical protein
MTDTGEHGKTEWRLDGQWIMGPNDEVIAAVFYTKYRKLLLDAPRLAELLDELIQPQMLSSPVAISNLAMDVAVHAAALKAEREKG